MIKQINQLTKLRGLGKVLATRFVESGLDSYDKIVAAGEEELAKIKGINPQTAAAIIRQSTELAADTLSKKEKKEEQLKEVAASLKDQIKGIATDVNDRFKEDLAGKIGKKVEKEIKKVILSLEKAETKLRTRSKRSREGWPKQRRGSRDCMKQI